MQIIAHRGFWKCNAEKNSLISSKRAIDSRFGVEIDVRDRLGSLVVSHDPSEQGDVCFSAFADILFSTSVPIAINIKSDGLATLLGEVIVRYKPQSYFAFDMSIPEMYNYSRKGIRFYTHISDLCTKPPCIEYASGIWLDSFKGLWYNGSILKEIVSYGLPICVVSEELHSRSHLYQWEMLREVFPKNFYWQLCTDKPDQAMEFFE